MIQECKTWLGGKPINFTDIRIKIGVADNHPYSILCALNIV